MIVLLTLSLTLTRLFDIQPSLQSLFPFKNQELNDNNEVLRKHALLVMETVDAAIELLKDGKLDSLVTTLIDLGVVHSMNNVKPEHFAVSFVYLPVLLYKIHP